MNPFDSVSNEVLYEICDKMPEEDLNKFVRTYSRAYEVCQDILGKRRKHRKISIEFSDKAGKFKELYDKYIYTGDSTFNIKDEYVKISSYGHFIDIKYDIRYRLTHYTADYNIFIKSVVTNFDPEDELDELGELFFDIGKLSELIELVTDDVLDNFHSYTQQGLTSIV